VRQASVQALEAEGIAWWNPARLLPIGATLPRDRDIAWLRGFRLLDGAEQMVPLEVASMSGEERDLPGRCQNTNGLASGNTLDEAVFHGLCELVERDAASLWSLMDMDEKRRRRVAPAAFPDPMVSRLAARFSRAGLQLGLFDQTTDLGLPTMLAVSVSTLDGQVRRFDVAAGSGTHPNPSRAALRAITEAAQSRITFIAGARDDIDPDHYRLPGAPEAQDLMSAVPRRTEHRYTSHGGALPAAAMLASTVQRLADCGIDDLVNVPLDQGDMDIRVARVLSYRLEDRFPNSNWRPGPRALGRLLDAP
jgi:ribosomal protein S12 methylthiotransferase accessory factor